MFSDFVDENPTQVLVSATESQRFGLSVGRLAIPFFSAKSDEEIAQLCAESSHDLIIVRVSASRAGLSTLLQELPKKSILQTDTLEYYSWDLSDLPPELDRPPEFETNASQQFGVVQSLVEVSFTGYQNHYSENPQLAQSATVEGYLEWVQVALQAKSARMFLTYKRGEPDPLGFVLADINAQHRIAEVLLNAVNPAHRRQGVYQTCMIDAARAMWQSDGVTRLVISTQSANTAVKAAWEQLGLCHWFSINTFHVMPTAT